jgi:predicted dithiol-disulfide oxidoreductase (DUF899 family)
MEVTEAEMAHPKIVSREEWLTERKKLLTKEKGLTALRDKVNADRRRLPMVKIDKEYVFEGPNGKVSLLDLFEGRRQLVIYHFMFDPAWEEGCLGCTGFINELGSLDNVRERDTTVALVSRAPLAKLDAYKAKQGWTLPWYSSFGSDFNYDYHATLDKSVAPLEYNYISEEEMRAKGETYFTEGEQHGMSVFFRMGGEVYHTYSTYARGNDGMILSYGFLDLTPYGRQEDFEESPDGFPQKPTYG